MRPLFKDRRQAGQKLAEKIKLSPEQKANTVLVALPRGGVEVGAEIARSFGLPLDILIVRKVGHPLYTEYGIGAVTEEDFSWLDHDALGVEKIPQAQLDEIFRREKEEVVRRKSLYRQNRPMVSVKGKNVILIDDGLATGVTARLAARFLRFRDAAEITLAIPVCLGRTEHLHSEFDKIICLSESSQFSSVGQYFREFDQLTDQQVTEMLSTVQRESPGPTIDIQNFHPVEQLVFKSAIPLKAKNDFDQLVQRLKDAKIVMLGESSHGTQEFYEWRRLISQELMLNHGFNFIAVEGDWPPCADVNDYIHLKNGGDKIYDVFHQFQRWPTWMWANTDTIKLAEWMKNHNRDKSAKNQVSFFGLDIYSFFESVDEVIKILSEIDPDAAQAVQEKYACLDPYDRNEKQYAKSLHQIPEGCSRQVIEALQHVLQLKLGRAQAHLLFDVQQNARIVKNAEAYYSSIIHGNEDSWNVRDRHMLETLNHLMKKNGPSTKAIVWAHNTHIGDYRATNMLEHGQVNLGGLAREEWGEDNVALLGFGTYRGEVTASRAWDGPTETMKIPQAPAETYEHFFHHVAVALESNSFFLWLKEDLKNSELKKVRGHRAIGVVYNPLAERRGNYVPTSLSERYDGFVFIDQTHALTPLKQKFLKNEIPETWPGGF